MANLQYRSETGALLNESAGRLFASVSEQDIRAAQLGQWAGACWGQVAEAGFLWLSSASGGRFGSRGGSNRAVGIAAFMPRRSRLRDDLANRLLPEAGFERVRPGNVCVSLGGVAAPLDRRFRWRIRGHAASVHGRATRCPRRVGGA